MPEATRPAATRPDVVRIVVTCDTSPLGAAALDAAAALAHRLDAELAGVFVENSNLLRMAALPFAREYALASAVARRIETGELERALQRQAEAMRGALSRAAHALSLPWSFQVVRGDLLNSVLEAMREPDLAVFGHTGQYAMSTDACLGAAVPRARVAGMRQPILTIYNDAAAATRALDAANVLAQVHHTSLIVLLITGDAAALSQLRARAAAQLEGSRVSVRFQYVSSHDTHVIKKVVETNHAAALLWHGVQTLDERRTFATLVDALKCPVVLVL